MKRLVFVFVIVLLLTNFLASGDAIEEIAKNRIAAVCLWAENIPETAEFYVELLGLSEQPVKQEDRMRLRLDGTILFILKGKPCAAKSDKPFPLFALIVDDLDKAAIFLKELNIKMPYGIQGSGRHRELQFYDPAGNLVELVQHH